MADVPSRVAELVETFDRHIEAYRSQQYNETQVRREFIDPFFEELGWDVTNKAGYAQAYKDVIHEDAIKIGGATKAPDYCFRIGGARKFFLEAKKPSVDIKGDPHPAYQLRRYAWSAKLPLSVLTDFEEFAVYDCRMRPKHTDKAEVARIMLFTYKDYLKHFSEIADIFSKEAILKGSFDKFAAATKGKRGTSTVDKEFLAEIEKWRNMLARIIALRNTALSVREINFSVQRTIDRILFLRMCEDRGIEPYGQLQSIISGERTYPRLCEVFEKADQKYNSGLFHFHEERDRSEGPDELTPNIIIDDKDLKWILYSLYYPQSPYEFSVLPAEILGNVYEQFLGKVITLTTGHRASVEDKPEVKKAGGVYYTPSYIVDYIVKNTIGKLCEEKTPRQVSNLRILDPACGSGSFLIGAYQYLLDWHLKHYTENDPEKYKKGRNPKIFETNSIRHCEEPGDEAISNYRLTITEKKRILINNIFGVDIDSQAVEVTKLSLLLKVLEGESSETLDNQYRLFHERALPDLANNIKCGNSLIGPDFYDNLDSSCHSRENGNPDELRDKINAFDWHAEFSEIFDGKNPGFDAVIGNPPYGAIANHEQLDYYQTRFQSASGSCDSFALFMEKSTELLCKGGLFGMIVQSAYVSSPSMGKLRDLLISRVKPVAFASMPYDVFPAYVDTVIVVTERLEEGKSLRDLPNAPVKLTVFPPRFRIRSVDDFSIFAKSADAVKWLCEGHNEFIVTLSDTEHAIIEKLQKTCAKFRDLSDIQRGVTPFNTFPEPPNINPRKAFRGTVRRYKLVMGESAFIRFDDSLAEYKPARYFVGPRILLRELISRQFQLQAVYVDEDFITNKSMQSFLLMDSVYSIFYLLGLLNSQLLSWYFLSVHSVGRRDDFPKIVLRQTRNLPFRKIDFSNTMEKTHHDRIVKFVKQILDLHNQLDATKIPDDKTRIQRQIDATDKQIDKLVYNLYDLTEEEIKIVEGCAP